MLDGDAAGVSRLIQVEQSILVEIPGFDGGGCAKLYVQSIGV